MAQQSTKPQVPPPPPLSTALAMPQVPPPPPLSTALTTPQVPPPSPLSIALATAGIIDEVVPEEGQNQILDLTTEPVGAETIKTTTCHTPYTTCHTPRTTGCTPTIV